MDTVVDTVADTVVDTVVDTVADTVVDTVADTVVEFVVGADGDIVENIVVDDDISVVAVVGEGSALVFSDATVLV